MSEMFNFVRSRNRVKDIIVESQNLCSRFILGNSPYLGENHYNFIQFHDKITQVQYISYSFKFVVTIFII